MSNTPTHWDSTYSAKGDKVSWHQDDPRRSLEVIRAAAPNLDAPIIDIGAGASRLADHLLMAGYSELTLLDLSAVALDSTRQRVGDLSKKVSWITADVTRWQPSRHYAVWHDRAVFHFLTDGAAQDAYIAALTQGTKPGSSVVIATFALTGPEKCSGLPVQRYSATTLAARLGPAFMLYTRADEIHHTPFGTTQDFTYAGFHRR